MATLIWRYHHKLRIHHGRFFAVFNGGFSLDVKIHPVEQELWLDIFLDSKSNIDRKIFIYCYGNPEEAVVENDMT